MQRIILLFSILPFFSFAQNKISSATIDSFVQNSFDEFPMAGVAIGVIQNGEVTHLKGYGTASAETGTKVDENTLFGIASNSKAFTTTALGMLADQGKLSWKDKVVDHIPEFRMYDPYVTEHFNIEDLVTHRSGLGLGAGDLMFYPPGSDFTIDDVIKSFQYQEPVSAFRTKYDYDNLLYLVAGEVIRRISGKQWDQFIEEEIMAKLGMKTSKGIYQNITDHSNVAMPHIVEDDKIKQVDVYTKKDGTMAASGGIYSNVNEMAQWVKMHLNSGTYGDSLEHRLISKKNHNELWKIRTLIFNDPRGSWVYNSRYSGYALGFFVKDQNGFSIIDHSGGMPGMLSMVTIIPELNAGIIVLTNCAPCGLSYLTLNNDIKDEIIGREDLHWIGYAEMQLNKSSKTDSIVNAVWEQVEKMEDTNLQFTNYTGTYRDDWFGEVLIYEKDNKLYFKSVRSPKLNGQMQYYQANTFAVAMDYEADNCDAFVTISLDENGKGKSITMKGISPDIDFSFDYQDLDLIRVEE